MAPALERPSVTVFESMSPDLVNLLKNSTLQHSTVEVWVEPSYPQVGCRSWTASGIWEGLRRDGGISTTATGGLCV